MTLLSAGVSAGFSLVGLFGPGGGDNFARYAASRSIALLVAVVIAICVRSRMALAVLGIAMTVVQACDGVIGALAHDPSKTYGPFAFAVLNALVVIRLLGDFGGSDGTRTRDLLRNKSEGRTGNFMRIAHTGALAQRATNGFGSASLNAMPQQPDRL